MKKHTFSYERGLYCVLGSLFAQACNPDVANQRQRNRTCRRDAHSGTKFGRMVLSDLEKVSPGLMGAGMGAESCAPGGEGWPVAAAASPESFQIAGALFGLGTFLVSSVCGKLATPEGRPDVFGVGACARIEVLAPSNANITRITGTSNVGPAAEPAG